MFYISYKNAFLSKSNIGIFQTFYLNFNLEQYKKKNYTSIPRILFNFLEIQL